MKTLKSIALFCLMILSQVVFAGEWTHINLQSQGVSLKVSYLKQILPATYGSQGGTVSSQAFVDVNTNSPALADRVEIFEVLSTGQIRKLQEKKLNEEHSRHFWAQLANGPSYADHLYVGSQYLLKLTIDGRVVEFRFKAI